jgi:hypothetical protein
VRHQGHIVEEEKSLGNLWATMTGLMGMKEVPTEFMGGEWDGMIGRIV